jgi:acetyltransferase-like isoleucine patch superfamily enzyme
MMSLYLFLKRFLFVGKNVKVGKNFHLGLVTWISAPTRLEIGDDVMIGKLCTIQCDGVIGDGVLISNNVGVIGRLDHDLREIGVLIRRAAHISESKTLQEDSRSRVEIGSNVWIGFGSTILSGVSIGRGAIVCAGSVVMTNVGAYDVVAGNPARRIWRRFTDEQILAHEAAIAGDRSNQSRRAITGRRHSRRAVKVAWPKLNAWIAQGRRDPRHLT